MKKIFILVQVVVAGLIVIAIVFSFFKPVPSVRLERESWRSWKGFFVLSFAGITDEEGTQYIRQERLEEHLAALKEAGYQAVGPENIASFLEGGSPLPDKAVLLLFEGGRKDSYLFATPLLQKYGMIGVMCVPVELTRVPGSFYLSEKTLKSLSGQANWRLCSMGDNALKNIPTGRSGSQGHFLTQRLWSGDKREDDASFQARVAGDYSKAAGVLERAGGKPVDLYLYPFADPGTGSDADPLATGVNRKAVSAHHRLAVISADSPFNGPRNDPYALNRLRVTAHLSSSELIKELETSAPRKTPVSGVLDDHSWVKYGNLDMKGGKAVLSAGAGLWLKGTATWSDLDFGARTRIAGGSSVAFFARYRGQESCIRLVVDPKELVLSEIAQNIPQTLARSTFENTGNQEHRFRLRVKGNRAWVWHNDILIAAKVPLSAASGEGRIGINAAAGSVEILDFNAEQIPNLYVHADGFENLPVATQQAMRALLAPWYSDPVRTGAATRRRKDLLAAAAEGVRTIPLLEMSGERTPDASERLVADLDAALQRDLVAPLVSRVAVRGIGNELSAGLRRSGYKILRIISPSEAAELAGGNLTAADDMFLVDGPEAEARDTVERLLKIIPPNRLVIKLGSLSPVQDGVGVAVDTTGI